MPGVRFQVSGAGGWTGIQGEQVPGVGFQVSGARGWTGIQDSGVRAKSVCSPPTAYCGLPTAYCRLPTRGACIAPWRGESHLRRARRAARFGEVVLRVWRDGGLPKSPTAMPVRSFRNALCRVKWH